MSKIEKEYFNRFSNKKAPKEDLDSDDLWDAISNDLGSPAPSIFGNLNILNCTLGVISMLLVTGLTALYFSNQTSVDSHSRVLNNEVNYTKQVEEQDIKTDKNDSSLVSINATSNLNQTADLSIKNNNINESHKDTPQQINNIPSANELRNIQSDEFDGLSNTQINSSKNTQISQLSNTQINSSANAQISQLSNNQFGKYTNSLIKNSINNQIRKSENIQISNAINSQTKIQNGNGLELLGNYFPLLASPFNSESLPSLFQNSIDINKPKSTIWHLNLSGGVNYLHFNFSSPDIPELSLLKEQTETGEIGANIGLGLSATIKNNWVISTGLNYSELRSRFEIKQSSSAEILKEDALIKVFLEQITGDTLFNVVGDTLVTGTVERFVLHHNKYRQFSIPLQIGFQKSYGAFTYGLHAGANLNFISSQKGRTLNAEAAIEDFDNNTEFAPFKSFNLGLQLSPQIRYQYSQKVSLSVQPRWVWQPKVGDFGGGLQLNAHQLHFEFGLYYKL